MPYHRLQLCCHMPPLALSSFCETPALPVGAFELPRAQHPPPLPYCALSNPSARAMRCKYDQTRDNCSGRDMVSVFIILARQLRRLCGLLSGLVVQTARSNDRKSGRGISAMKADKKVTVCDVNSCHDWALPSQVSTASPYNPLSYVPYCRNSVFPTQPTISRCSGMLGVRRT